MSEEWGGKGCHVCVCMGERERERWETEVCACVSVSNAEWKPESQRENKGRRLSGDCVRTANVYL